MNDTPVFPLNVCIQFAKKFGITFLQTLKYTQ